VDRTWVKAKSHGVAGADTHISVQPGDHLAAFGYVYNQQCLGAQRLDRRNGRQTITNPATTRAETRAEK
jgi:hypothetical protein